MTYEKLTEKIPSYRERTRATLDVLREYVGSTFKDDAALFEAIKEQDSDLDDAIHEIADGNVSVYTYDRMKWLTENLGRADQENAIACGAKTAEEIAAYCWYEAEREDIYEDLKEIRDILDVEDEDGDEA